MAVEDVAGVYNERIQVALTYAKKLKKFLKFLTKNKN
jgi:hypothetical protein